MKSIYRSAKSRIETKFNKFPVRELELYPDAKPCKTRTIDDDLALAEKLRNSDEEFYLWYAAEGYCYARYAHQHCRPYFSDYQNEIGDLIFTVHKAIKLYGKNKKIIPLGNFCIFCCRRRLYTIGRRWKCEKRISYCDVDEQVHDSGMLDTKAEPPEFNYCIKEFLKHIKTLLSKMELEVFEQLSLGKRPAEIYDEKYLEQTGFTDWRSSEYKTLDNTFQRISRKLREDKKCLAFYEQLLEHSKWRNRSNDSHRDIWEWTEYSLKQRNKK